MTDHCKIPQKLIDQALDQWSCLAHQAYDIFGLDCTVVYLNSISSSTSIPSNNTPELNSINSRRRSSGQDYDFQDNTITTTENSDIVRIKIYWTAREWKAVFGYTAIPDGSVLFYAKLEDAEKLSQAIRVEYVDELNKKYTFTRSSEPVPSGF